MFYRKISEDQQADIDRSPLSLRLSTVRTQLVSRSMRNGSWHVIKTSAETGWITMSDLNCAVVCARKNENGLSLREVAERMGVSFPRISQIEHAAFKKLKAAGVFEEE